MTTAARPTFEPARGGRGKGEGDLSQLSKQYSSRDLPSHTKIKYRLVLSFLILMAKQTGNDFFVMSGTLDVFTVDVDVLGTELTPEIVRQCPGDRMLCK